MEISFRGKYDQKLFYQAVILANQPPKSRRSVRTFMLVFIVIAFGVLISRLIESGDILGNATYIALIMLVGAFLGSSYLQPYLAARRLWQNPSVQQPLTGMISSKGILYKLVQGQNHIPWENLNRVRKKADLTTLVTITGLLLIFPKRFFRNEADWQRFNTLVDKKIIQIQ